MKTKALKLIVFTTLSIAVGVVSIIVNEQAMAASSSSTTVQVVLSGWNISISSTGSFALGTFTVSSSSQTVSWSFTDPFTVDDLKGADNGYYTTLQLSWGLVGPNSATIAAANVSAKVSSDTVTTVSWTTNSRVVVASGLLSFSSLDTARTFIKRDTASNFGVVGKYGSAPQLQVVIPGYTAAGTYAGTLVYTLYEN